MISTNKVNLIYSRNDIITKTMTDIPSLSRDVAEQKVDQFLLDCEMVNMYIQYGKEVEKNPDFVVPDNDSDNDTNAFFTPRNIVAAYLGYVGITSGPQIIRRYIAEQEVKGEWVPTKIQFFDDWIDRTSVEATARILQKATNSVVQISSDASTDAMSSSSSSLPSDIVMMVQPAVTESLQSMVDAVSVSTP
jgi:hypothetical protein